LDKQAYLTKKLGPELEAILGTAASGPVDVASMTVSPSFMQQVATYLNQDPTNKVKMALNRVSMEDWSQTSDHRVQLTRCARRARERERERVRERETHRDWDACDAAC
jgi:hypothetical protein